LQGFVERTVAAEGQIALGWRDVPVRPEHTGEVAGACRPVIRQLLVGAGPDNVDDQDAFERKLYVIRRVCELTAQQPGLYMASSSSRTVNYKGMLISYQLAAFYPDLQDERVKSAMALVHSRFSTNTFPSWELAHPYRVVCHNGEINTLMGNVNWMRARESQLASELFGRDLRKVLPIVRPGGSDTGILRIAPEEVEQLGRLQPGKLFLVDLEQGRIVDDAEVKHTIATQKPYGEWYERNIVHFSDLPEVEPPERSSEPLRTRQL